MARWKWKDLNDAQKKQFTASVYAETAGRNTKQKRDERFTLGGAWANTEGVVHISGTLHCRITRRFSGRSREYDGDNFSGGCKEIRDAIASLLGLKGDSEKDGITWEYEQERAEKTETVIEIYSKRLSR